MRTTFFEAWHHKNLTQQLTVPLFPLSPALSSICQKNAKVKICTNLSLNVRFSCKFENRMYLFHLCIIIICLWIKFTTILITKKNQIADFQENHVKFEITTSKFLSSHALLKDENDKIHNIFTTTTNSTNVKSTVLCYDHSSSVYQKIAFLSCCLLDTR